MAIVITVDETANKQNTAAAGQPASNDVDLSALPDRFNQALAAAGVIAGTVNQLALSGATAANQTGSNVVPLSGNINDVLFSDANGAPLVGAPSNLSTVDGLPIYLYTSTTDNNVVLGRVGAPDPDGAGPLTGANPNGTVAFAAFLDTGASDVGATGAKLWLLQFLPLFHPDTTNPNDIVSTVTLNFAVDSTQNFSLEKAPSGQNLFLMFGDGTPASGELAIIATGFAPNTTKLQDGDTINSSQGGSQLAIGTNKQMIDANEAVWLTWVKSPEPNFTVPNLDQNEADVEANIKFGEYFETSTASFVVAQTQPNSSSATMTLTAYDNDDTETGPGGTFISGLKVTDDSVNIASVVVTRGATKLTFASAEGSITKDTVTVDFAGDSATISGLVATDKVEYVTSDPHDRLLLKNTAAKTAFDVGGFGLAAGKLTPTALGELAFIDDGPTVTTATVTRTVDEDGVTGGNAAAKPGDVAGEVTKVTGSVSTLFDAGVDKDGSFALSATTSGLDQQLKSGATAVTYAVNGNKLTASAGAKTIYTFEITDTKTGAFEFNLSGPLNHAAGQDENDLTLDLSSVVLGLDKEGDSVKATAGALTIVVDDDSPDDLTPGDLKVANKAGSTGTANLGYAANVGADVPGTVKFVGTDGMLLKGVFEDGKSLEQTLQLNGSDLRLYFNEAFTALTASTATVETGITATNTAFTMALTPNADSTKDLYSLTVVNPISNTVDVEFGSFTAKPASGNPLTLVVNDIGGSTVDALFSGFIDPSGKQDTVNVSGAGVGVGNGQDFDKDGANIDRMMIQFLEDDGDGALEAGEAEAVNRFTFIANQNNSPNDDGDAVIRIYDAANKEVTITSVLVNGKALTIDGAGVLGNDKTTVTADSLTGGGVLLEGLGGGQAGDTKDNDTITIIGATTYTRIDISGVGDDNPKDTFDILLKSVAVPQPFDVSFDVKAQLVDEDVDPSAAVILDVLLVGTPST